MCMNYYKVHCGENLNLISVGIKTVTNAPLLLQSLFFARETPEIVTVVDLIYIVVTSLTSLRFFCEIIINNSPPQLMKTSVRPPKETWKLLNLNIQQVLR